MRLYALIFAALLMWPVASKCNELSPPIDIDFKLDVISKNLTQQTVQQIFQDSTGLMWFVTQEGLNKYDGFKLENFTFTPSNLSSLSTNSVSRIAEDSRGTLWISTWGGGLNKFNASTNSFSAIYASNELSHSPLSNEINTIFKDNDGILWLGYENAFSAFDPVTEEFRHYLPQALDLPYLGIIKHFSQTSDGTLWAATQGGLLEINSDQVSVHRTDEEKNDGSIVSNDIISVTVDSQDNVWAISRDSGVSIFSPDRHIFKNLAHNPDDPTSLASNQSYEAYEDSVGQMWIGTNEGLNLYLGEANGFLRFSRDNTELPSDIVKSIYQSREGKYWVGTYFGLASGTQNLFTKVNSLRNHISSDSINAFAETPDGSLWVGTDDGLNRLRPGEQVFEWINESTYPRIPNPDVMSLLSVENELWIGTFNAGLTVLDLSTGTSITYKHEALNDSSIGANGITSLLQTSGGTILVGTYGGGLSIYDELSNSFTTKRNIPREKTSLSDDNVIALFQDSFGLIWIGTEKGLNRFDLESNSFERFYSDASDPSSIASDIAWAFYEDSTKHLWIGTRGGGLERWGPKERFSSKNEFDHYSTTISLPSSNIYGISSDEGGNLWLSHNRGVTKLDPDTLEANHFGIKDGLQDSEFNMGASFKASNGTIYFGGNRGFNIIPSKGIQSNSISPQVSISDIRIMNQSKSFDSPYHALKALELSYQDRMLSVEFFASDYSNPRLVQYAYKLEGVNPDWVISPEAHIASFTTLPPGKYDLKLAAASPNGIWNWDAFTLPIVVHPPPWKSPIAYAIYGLAGTSLIAFFVIRQNRESKKALERQRDLEAKVAERTTDLQEARLLAEEANKAKSSFLATMSHEIRTPMHGMIGMTELLMHTELSEQQQRFAKAAHNSGESLLNLINEILDFSKIEAAKVELEAIDFCPVELVDEICYLQGEPAHRRGIQIFNICESSNPIRLVGDPTKIRQVIMNLVSNSIKFTHAGSVTVRVSTKPDAHNLSSALTISVNDTGIGMTPDTQKQVFEAFIQADTSTTRQYGGTGLGLAISKQYIDMMGGEIVVDSEPGKGTSVAVHLILPHSKSEEAKDAAFENLSGYFLCDSAGTTEMVTSHFNRLGIQCCTSNNPDILENSLHTNEFAIVDYEFIASNQEARVIVNRIESNRVLVLTPLTVEVHFPELDRWREITKPVTLQSLNDGVKGIFSDLLLNLPQKSSNNLDSARLTRRILVAEDVLTNQKIATEMLQILDCEVEIANDGSEALEMFKAGDFQLIFMDCQMPKMDGFEATKRIRLLEEKYGTDPTPIVALTAGIGKEDKARCLEVGMDGYLTKPFSIAELGDCLQHHICSEENNSTKAMNHMTQNNSPSSTEPKETSDIFNIRAINNIIEVEEQAGRPLLPTILDGFTKQMLEKLSDISENSKSGDSENLYRTAHAIKSMSANIGAERVRIISAKIEADARNGDILEVEKSISLLSNAYQEFVREFRSTYTSQ